MISLKFNGKRGGDFPYAVFSIFFFLLVLYPTEKVFAQLKHDYVWALGYNNHPDGSPPGFWGAEFLLSFHSNPPDTIRLQTINTRGRRNTMSMANSLGELIFSSNGCSLFDAEGQKLPGGEELVFGPRFNRQCQNTSLPTYTNWDASTIALPMDNKDSLFFVIYHRREINREAEGFENPLGVVSFELYKIKVVLNGNGEYEAKDRTLIFRQNLGNGNFAAVRDTQANYWWLIIPPDYHLNNYEIIRLGPDGVDTIHTQYFFYEGEHFENELVVSGGSAVFSPDGTMYVRWIAEGEIGTMLWDFDREKGVLSNFRYLPHPDGDDWIFHESNGGGVSFSPNGRFLYVNTLNNLYQYDMWEDDIEASVVHIGEYDGFRDSSTTSLTSVRFLFSRLAPNCKIYIVPVGTARYMHVINHPNRKGLACDFQQHSLVTPGKNFGGLPYHPNYRIDSEYPLCDSTITSTWFIPDEPDPGIYLYPNPARDYAIVGWSEKDPMEITLYDMSGREVYRSRMQPGLPEYYLDLSGFGAGVYVVRVRMRDGSFGVERLVLMD